MFLSAASQPARLVINASCCVLLVVSGVFKLVGDPATGDSLQKSYGACVFLLGAIGLILINRIITSRTLLIVFALFAAYNAHRFLLGFRNCNCFGVISPDLRAVLLLDLILVVALIYVSNVSVSIISRGLVSWCVGLCLALVGGTILERVNRSKHLQTPSKVELMYDNNLYGAHVDVSASAMLEVIGLQTSCPCISVTPRTFELSKHESITLDIKSSQPLTKGGTITLFLKSGQRQQFDIFTR